MFDFDTLPDRRGTASLKWDFGGRIAGREGLLPLWVADMDFTAPAFITGAVARRAAHGVFGYTLEPESYFEAAMRWLLARHGWNVRREWLLAAPGVVQTISTALLAASAPGDRIVIQPPVYYPFALRIRANGREVAENPLVLDGGRYRMDDEGLERELAAGARMLILCSPHNPGGRVWTEEELERAAGLCARHGAVIVSDEIHADLVLPGRRHVPIASVSEEAGRITITCVSTTKTFNLAGLGGSLAIASDEGLRERLTAVAEAQWGGTANCFAAAASEAAWRQGADWLDAMLAYVAGNFAHLADRLPRELPGARVLPLEATYLAWIDLRKLGLSDDEVRVRLLDAGIWLDEGRKFGRGGEGFQRLNLACPRSVLSRAVDGMVRALGPLPGSLPAGA
jgi:cysteine-S-conjugate beta-lyase